MKSLSTAAVFSLALAACQPPAERPPGSEAAVSEKDPAPTAVWFREVTAETGLDFEHRSGLDGSFFMPEHIGSGGALFDYDGDGDLDLYLVTSGEHGTAAGSAVAPSAASRNRLWRQDADGRFHDRTGESGLGDLGYGMGCAVGDVEGDGDLDVYVTNYGRDVFYRNRGDGSFVDETDSAGLGDESWSTSACFFDADLDGRLDLYVVTYLHLDQPRACTDAAGRPEYCGPAAYRGLSDLFYRGAGDGDRAAFVDAGEEAGMTRVANRGLGVVCADLDGDHRPDVYVANDGEGNQLWHNLGGGEAVFEDRATLLGAATNFLGQPEASMGIALGDVDGDRRLDLFLAHLDRETNTFYRNLGAGGFQDATAAWGLGPASLPYTGFGAAFFDADHDGDLDLAVANGRVRRGPPLVAGDGDAAGELLPGYWRDYAEPNLFFVRDGERFRDASSEAGGLAAEIEVSRGLVVGDVDLDGALDVLITNCNGPARLYRNQIAGSPAAAGRRWLELRVFDRTLGRDALGAEVTVEAGDRTSFAAVTSTYSYLASVEPRLHFGLADAERATVTIRWPDGHRRRIVGVPADRRVTVYR